MIDTDLENANVTISLSALVAFRSPTHLGCERGTGHSKDDFYDGQRIV